jgi:hypothetical protein
MSSPALAVPESCPEATVHAGFRIYLKAPFGLGTRGIFVHEALCGRGFDRSGAGTRRMRFELQFNQYQRKLDRHASQQWQHDQLCIWNHAGCQRQWWADGLEFQLHDQLALFSIGHNGNGRLHDQWKLQRPDQWRVHDGGAIWKSCRKYADPHRYRSRQHDFGHVDSDWKCRMHWIGHLYNDEGLVRISLRLPAHEAPEAASVSQLPPHIH